MTFRSQLEERKQNTSQDLPAHTGSWTLENTALGGRSTKLLYFLVGGGIGAVTALMFAPKAGAELRHDISEITRTGYDETVDLAKNVKAHTADIASNVKEHTADLAHNVREHSAEIFNSVKQKADRMYGLASEKLSLTHDLTGEDQAGVSGDVLQMDDKMNQQQPHMRNKSTDIM